MRLTISEICPKGRGLRDFGGKKGLWGTFHERHHGKKKCGLTGEQEERLMTQLKGFQAESAGHYSQYHADKHCLAATMCKVLPIFSALIRGQEPIYYEVLKQSPQGLKTQGLSLWCIRVNSTTLGVELPELESTLRPLGPLH